jgi:hypothetical protein
LKILHHFNSFCGAELSNDINEAIAELEEFMKPKSCNECKWQIDETEKQHKWCGIHGTSKVGYEMNDFYCNRYEPKETL